MSGTHQLLLAGGGFSFIPNCITQIGDVTPGSAQAAFTVHPDGTLTYDWGNSNIGGPRWGYGVSASSGLWVQVNYESGSGIGPAPTGSPQALTTARQYSVGAVAEENFHAIWRFRIANNSAMTAPFINFTFPGFADSRSFGGIIV